MGVFDWLRGKKARTSHECATSGTIDSTTSDEVLQAGVHNDRGVSYHEQGDYQRAIREYDQAIALNPQLVEAYSNRAQSRTKLGRLDDALGDYQRATQIRPDWPKGWMLTGATNDRLGQRDRAIQDFTRAIELKPDYVEAYVNRGNCFGRLERHQEALRDFDRAIQLQPDLADTYLSRGISRYFLGQKHEANADLDHAAKLGAGRPDFVRQVASTRSKLAEFSQTASTPSKPASAESSPDTRKPKCRFAYMATEANPQAMDIFLCEIIEAVAPELHQPGQFPHAQAETVSTWDGVEKWASLRVRKYVDSLGKLQHLGISSFEDFGQVLTTTGRHPRTGERFYLLLCYEK